MKRSIHHHDGPWACLKPVPVRHPTMAQIEEARREAALRQAEVLTSALAYMAELATAYNVGRGVKTG